MPVTFSGATLKGTTTISSPAVYNPLQLFGANVQGVWYDSSDMSVMYQDNAGVTPVTAVEQTVGLWLDKSQGLVLGSELVTNGDFSGGLTGWTLTGGYSPTVSGGVLVFNGGSSTGGVYQSCMTAGSVYQITYTIVSYTSGAFKIGAGTTYGPLRSAAGTYTETRQAIGDGLLRLYGDSTNFVGTIDNVSVKLVPGNHATQATPSFRPTLSARYNLLTYTEDLTNAVWLPIGVTKSTSTLMYPSSSGTDRYVYQIIQATVGVDYKTRLRLKNSGKNFAYVYNVRGDQRFWVDLTTGNTSNVGSNISNLSTSVAGDGWVDISFTSTRTSGGTAGEGYIFVGISDAAGSASVTANGTDGILFSKADIRATNDGVGIPSYQRVSSSTSYDTTGFPMYLLFNGTNSIMGTNNINFTATNQMSIFSGIRALGTSTSVAAELSSISDNNDGTFFLVTSSTQLRFRSKGTSPQEGTYNVTPPATYVATMQANIGGPYVVAQYNTTLGTPNTASQGTGNYGTYPLYLGARGSGPQLYWNGRMYQLIIRNLLSSAGQIADTVNWINSKTAAY